MQEAIYSLVSALCKIIETLIQFILDFEPGRVERLARIRDGYSRRGRSYPPPTVQYEQDGRWITQLQAENSQLRKNNEHLARELKSYQLR